ncbi:MAG: hypothetical protein QXX32_00945 [Thermofilum sp.]|uniref:hypothetical protein n=1 Tax=Thermofilum sp. TaxID=1961369 RepID=UPI003160D3DC
MQLSRHLFISDLTHSASVDIVDDSIILVRILSVNETTAVTTNTIPLGPNTMIEPIRTNDAENNSQRGSGFELAILVRRPNRRMEAPTVTLLCISVERENFIPGIPVEKICFLVFLNI